MNIRRLRLTLLLAILAAPVASAAEPQRFLRFEHDGKAAYGRLEGERVRALDGDLFGTWQPTERTYRLDAVKILPPTQPTQVLALAGNYCSHLDDDTVPPQFAIPQPFFKSPSCLIGHGQPIVIPRDATTVHYEAELVIVIGKRCRRVAKEHALEYVLGITAGNDVSERIWQNDEATKDVQWWRAKGSDTFGPVGPYIATGIDFGNLRLRLRHNGQVKQDESTSHFIHDIPTVVSFISQYVTLEPGDLIFTGTPGTTSAIQAGDVVEVELEGVGTLSNPVERE
jgi:2-keto-4-pentenoate hydratase/2-oxohepta-3-ene-1,7-dioic acid hydratase in catechol pathway